VSDLPARVAVIGGGTMGAVLARVLAEAGCEVALHVRTPRDLEIPGVRITSDLDDALDGADLVSEAITEAVEPKRAVLERALARCPDAIVTTQTSALPLDDLARGPRFAGWHWSNPPDLMDVVEICPGAETDPAVIDRLIAITEALGKAPAVLRWPVPGYLLNRLQYALMREAWNLVESGVCDFEDVDRALTHGLGLRWAAIGPFEVQDVAGLDVHLAVAESLMPVLAGEREPPPALREMVARGDRGTSTGKGLRGEYDEARTAEVLARRERVMRAVKAARDGKLSD
jgi:3-hydroxybutyryl-CoA dehydrogenase